MSRDQSTVPAPAAVDLVDVVTLLDRFPALSGLHLRVTTGTTVLLRGPNGAGKTTVLKVCAGLAPVASGSATVLGHDVGLDRRAVRRQVAMLGHAGFLYDDLTIAENVRFSVRAAGGDGHEVGPALARLGLEGRLARLRVGACSAGQRRRTSLAVVVARRPRLWLLDEPHAALDVEGRDLLDAVVREAVATGSTVLLASHDEDRAVALASRVVTVAGGHVVADVVTQAPRGPSAGAGGGAGAVGAGGGAGPAGPIGRWREGGHVA